MMARFPSAKDMMNMRGPREGKRDESKMKMVGGKGGGSVMVFKEG